MERHKLAVVRAIPWTWERNIFQHCVSFDIKTISKPQYFVDKERAPIRVVSLVPPFLKYTPFISSYHFFVFKNLEEALKDMDVVNSAELYTFLTRQCTKISNRTKAKLAITVWQTIPYHTFYNFIPPYALNTRLALKHAHLFLALTKKAIGYLQSLSAPREKIRLLYPGVDLKIFKPSKKLEHENVRILFVGRLVPQKGILFLLRAFSLLCKALPNVELWIIGRGKLASSLATYSQKYPIKYLGGWLSSNEVVRAYQQCDAFCLPTIDYRVGGFKVWEEQFGMVLVEAMACGLPIIATDCGAIPEVVGRQNPIIPQRSVRDLYGPLYKIAKDDDYRQSLGKANRFRAEKLFDVRKQGEKLNKYLSELL